MRVEQIPVLIQIFLCHPPEQIRIAHCREDIVRLHAIVAIIGSDLKEFRQIPMPAVKVNRDGPLTHAQLINRYRGIIDQPDPAQHTARGALKSPDITAGSADLAKYSPSLPPCLEICAKLSSDL